MSVLEIKDNMGSVTEMKDLVAKLTFVWKELIRVINGRINFGDNIQGIYVTADFIAADIDLPVQHFLGFVPTGYLVVKKSVNLNVYDGVSVWNQNAIYLRSSAKGSARLFIF